MQSAIAQLRVIGGELTKDDDITFEGTRYVFPAKFQGDLQGLWEDVSRYVQGQQEEIKIEKTYEYRPYDGAHATYQVLKQYFGYAQSIPTKTFFGKEAPQEITIPIGYVNGEMEQMTVPWGRLLLPGVREAFVQTGHTMDNERGILFKATAVCKRKDKFTIDGFLAAIQHYLDNGGSIYEGKAMTGNLEFIDVDLIDPSKFIYTEQAWADVETSILSPLRDYEAIKKAGLSVKRATLLEGPYGTGKSGMGAIAAKIAQANKVTAMMCRPGRDDPFDMLSTLMLYSSRGRRGFGFIEDVDVFAANQDPEWVTRLLDAFDSARSKGLDITLVMTTNHKDDIHKGMLRPGRLDAIIEIGSMDRTGVEKLTKQIVGGQLDDDIDYDEVYAATTGYMPAFVREGVERALRYTIARTGSVGPIATIDLVRSLNSLRPQFDLHEKANDRREKLPPLDRMMRLMIGEESGSDAGLIGQIVNETLSERLEGAALIRESDGEHTHQVHLVD